MSLCNTTITFVGKWIDSCEADFIPSCDYFCQLYKIWALNTLYKIYICVTQSPQQVSFFTTYFKGLNSIHPLLSHFDLHNSSVRWIGLLLLLFQCISVRPVIVLL